MKGAIRDMTAYGAFVELEDGIDGMIHVSDLSWTRKINHPSEVFKKNDEVEAVVIDIDGLVHISQLSEDHVAKVKDVLKVGQEVEARVIKVDKVERRIGLSIKAANYSEEELKRESEAFDNLRPGEDMVGLEKAFEAAEEDYRPGEGKKK